MHQLCKIPELDGATAQHTEMHFEQCFCLLLLALDFQGCRDNSGARLLKDKEMFWSLDQLCNSLCVKNTF